MASGDGSSHQLSSDDRGVQAHWASYSTLEQKVDSLSQDMQRLVAAFGARNEQMRERGNKSQGSDEPQVSPMVIRALFRSSFSSHSSRFKV
ncbi:hypothetical protein LWI29_033368 [Acer saccharum]|uniref:Uncharacterized protein n=1 Tax=Acer saccharum TaxID=4024 RepID=A0AA39S0L0_ACESA|nr:hypothetical protein LWI29_033368 [Acer saccharum]